ncbi:SGNH/GDSL hydrolase family protein [Legionella nagasakiensis]|uniref:SGNH/GDSL hydrolase family protein n=1 Tax=Legionella nagasakiensis TaxID=535290 RepID=UPI0010557ACC|nr:SGNH/GDSL hydrolase family protein [Legionella nagasakiensis]
MKAKKISHFIMMGDSLSDRGTLDHRYLLGCIPMASLSGLSKHSPIGRFTNGLAWSDFISAMIADEFLIEETEERDQEAGQHREEHDVTDIADDIITNSHSRPKTPADVLEPSEIADEILTDDPRIKKLVRYSYFLNDDRFVRYQGRDFVRNYDEGGLTAHDYSWMPSTSVSRFVSRIILSKLATMRNKLLAYDRDHELSRKHKAETLVLEWSGANDLITVNAHPSKEEVNRAIKDRITNAEQLIKNGYRHFVLFNLPDLSLTPRYQAKSQEERDNAHACSLYFNEQLAKACKELAETYPHCSVDVFDVSSLFTEIYQHPEAHGFDPAKLRIPYTESADFKINPDRTSPAKGYMFWDDVHPTADLHALLAERFYEKYSKEYHFLEPQEEALEKEELDISEEALRASFIRKYESKLQAEQSGFFGSFRRSNINFRQASLKEILVHALYGGGHRTREVIMELQWIDAAGNLDLNIPVLKEAKEALDFERSQQRGMALDH